MPGVTSAVAVPAYAGVPVTHRGLVTAFTVVAGHSRSVDPGARGGGTNWEALAQAGGTIVVLMGAAHRRQIADRLMAGGLPAQTPVVVVPVGGPSLLSRQRSGTTPRRSSRPSRLATHVTDRDRARLPGLTLVGTKGARCPAKPSS